MAEEQPVTRRPRKWVDYDRETHGNPLSSSCAKPQDGATNLSEKYPATGMQKPIPKFSDATPAVSQYLGEAVVVPIRRTMKGRGVIDRERAKFAEFADAFNRTGSALDAMLDMAERGQFLGICSVDDQAMAMMRDLIELFQRVYIGIALPKCAANRALWEKPSHKGPETKPLQRRRNHRHRSGPQRRRRHTGDATRLPPGDVGLFWTRTATKPISASRPTGPQRPALLPGAFCD